MVNRIQTLQTMVQIENIESGVDSGTSLPVASHIREKERDTGVVDGSRPSRLPRMPEPSAADAYPTTRAVAVHAAIHPWITVG